MTDVVTHPGSLTAEARRRIADMVAVALREGRPVVLDEGMTFQRVDLDMETFDILAIWCAFVAIGAGLALIVRSVS